MLSTQPIGVRCFRAGAQPLVRFLFRAACQIELAGLNNIPINCAYIVAWNHVSTLDAPLLLAFWPQLPEAVGGAKLMESAVIGWLMKAYGTIPVHRGEYDRAAIHKTLQVLKSNRAVIISPEGGRTQVPGLRAAKPGIAYLAIKAKVPIVPVGITGTETIIAGWGKLHRPRVTMNIGRPYWLVAESIPREYRHEFLANQAALVMKRIAILLPPEYRGTYG